MSGRVSAGATWVLAVTAVVQASAGLAAFFLLPRFGTPLPPLFLVAEILAFQGVGSFLLVRGRQDERCRALGLTFLVVGTTFTIMPLRLMSEVGSPVASSTARWVLLLPTDAFCAWAVWNFTRRFPRTVELRFERVARVGTTVAFVAGVLLWVGSSAAAFALHDELLAYFDRLHPSGSYWTFSASGTLAGLVFGWWKSRRASHEEQMRGQIIVVGVLLAVLPTWVLAALQASSELVDRFLATSISGRMLMQAVRILLLTVPVSAAYALVVDRVFEIRVNLKMTLQHRLAHLIVGAGIMVPVTWLLWQLHGVRDVPLQGLFIAENALPLGVPLLISSLGIILRRRAVERLDRAFFRSAYDPLRVLAEVIKQVEQGRSTKELFDDVAAALTVALHPERTLVLVLDSAGNSLVAAPGIVAPLPLSSSLASTMATKPAPLDLVLQHGEALGADDVSWLSASGCVLGAPVVLHDGRLVGCIAFGPHKSGLPYDLSERMLLNSVCSAMALGISTREGKPSEVPAEPAAECAQCGLLAAELTSCTECGVVMISASVPYRFQDKYRFERRIGRGGMGVVYRAVDITLERAVAVKTLPVRSAEESVSLLLEARTMAKVTHQHLALIYSAETWRGTPLLIVEFLGKGTLSDRLDRQGPITAQEVIAIGIQLFSALGQIHQSGVLHRDVKPSNLGLSDDDKWKLMDFGLARILASGTEKTTPVGNVTHPHQTQITQGYVGTPLYMSPQALWGTANDASIDLWAASMSLYEALAGRHPFSGMSWLDTQQRLLNADIPELHTVVPSCPARLADLIHRGMHREPHKRPGSAVAFERELRALAVG